MTSAKFILLFGGAIVAAVFNPPVMDVPTAFFDWDLVSVTSTLDEDWGLVTDSVDFSEDWETTAMLAIDIDSPLSIDNPEYGIDRTRYTP